MAMSEKKKQQQANRGNDMLSYGTKNIKSYNCLDFLNDIETDSDGSELQWFNISFHNNNLFIEKRIHDSHEMNNTYEVKYSYSSIKLLENAGCCADGFQLSINSTATVDDVFTEIISVVSEWVINDVRNILLTIFI